LAVDEEENFLVEWFCMLTCGRTFSGRFFQGWFALPAGQPAFPTAGYVVKKSL
jgi:hypothetical protein